MDRRLLLATFVGGILAGVAGWLLWPMAREQERTAAELMDVVMWGKEPIGGPFTLIDHEGKLRTDTDFRGKLLLVYFGFTACADACPTDLAAMAGAVDKLGPAGDRVQPLFITVNPELDTPEQLKTYVALFHPRLIGLTGDRRQIRDVTHAYKVYFVKTAPAIRSDPNINHSSVVYVVGVDGNYIGFFPPGTPADRMVAVLQSQLAVLAKASPDRKDSRLQRSARAHETINERGSAVTSALVINGGPGNVRVRRLHI